MPASEIGAAGPAGCARDGRRASWRALGFASDEVSPSVHNATDAHAMASPSRASFLGGGILLIQSTFCWVTANESDSCQ